MKCEIKLGEVDYMKQDSMPQVARFWNDIVEEFDSIYTGKDKGAIAKAMDRYFRSDIYGRFDWVMDRVGSQVSGQAVCDIGCGTGRFVTELAKRGAKVVMGVDVAPNMIEKAKEICRKDGTLDKCEFGVSDVLDWKPNRQYDTTIAIGFWDYIEEPPERLRRIRAFTTGTFLSAWPRYWTWRMPVRKVRLQYVRGCPCYFFKREEAVKMIEDAGFKVNRVDVIGQLFCIDAKAR